MPVNQHIIVAVAIIGGTGAVNALLTHRAVTPVIIGSYLLLLVLAVADLAGGGISQLAGGIAMLAVVYVLLTQFPWSTILHMLGVR